MQESTIIRRSGRTIVTVLALATVAVVVAPAAQADDWKHEQASQAVDYGIPRAMPSDYAKAGVTIGAKYTAFVSDFPRSSDMRPRAGGGSDHAERIVGDSPFVVSNGREVDTGIEWAPLAVGMAIGLGLSVLLGLSLLSLRRRRTFAHA